MIVGVKAMSFAMDDLSRSYGVDQALQTRLIEETRMAEKPADIKTTDSTRNEPEVNDMFEATKQKQDLVKNTFEGVQEESTAIDITKEALKKITSFVKDIKSTIESENSDDVSRKKIDDNYEKINQVAKEASFNDKKLIEKEELRISDIKKLEITTPKQKEESVEKLNDIINNIKNKEQDFTKKQEELTRTVNKNSLVELKLPTKPESETEVETEIKKEEAVSAEKLKESAIKNINDAPKKSIKMHIQHLDKNLLLAMLSLRSA